MTDRASGETRDDRGRLPGRLLRRRQLDPEDARHRHERRADARIQSQHLLPREGALELSRQGQGALHFFADAQGIWRTLVQIDGRELWRLGIRGQWHFENPDKVDASAMITEMVGREIPHEVVSSLPWVARDLVADHYVQGPRLPRRRRRAPEHAVRRLRPQHRHGRRQRSRLEARGAGAGLGRAAADRLL